MTDTKNTGDKTLHMAPSKTLTLKRATEQGVVRQSFSHGRSKAVVVEKVKRRVMRTERSSSGARPLGLAFMDGDLTRASAALRQCCCR